jgi:hemoglobin-like flavoprotein
MTETPDYEKVFHLSYWRATQHTMEGVTFVDAFYDNFLASSSAIAGRFNRANFDSLKRMLALSIVHVAKFYPTGQPDVLLRVLATRHSQRDLDVRPELYDDWMEALLSTVKAFDPKYDELPGEAWRRVLEPGVAFMKSRYTASDSNPAADAS